MVFYVVELLDDWNKDVPRWKYPRNLEPPRVSSPGFGNDSKRMLEYLPTRTRVKLTTKARDTTPPSRLDRKLF
ncbi:hypothetical protein TNCV_1891851 [Trichonephila clavipes]|nr:hypothetical protein TNCV_1891851 [Trichonephila clavipes]